MFVLNISINYSDSEYTTLKVDQTVTYLLLTTGNGKGTIPYIVAIFMKQTRGLDSK